MKPQRFYLPELDLLRFGAFLLVFLCHTITPAMQAGPHGHLLVAIKTAGALGVPVFFFLSAYLITQLLVIEKNRTGLINIRSFYVRRILRIWPLYFGFLGAIYLIGFVVSAFHFPTAGLPYYLLLSGNWWKGPSSFAAPLWSISVEEQFYLLWPTLAKWFTIRGLAMVSVGFWCVSQIALLFLSQWHLPIGTYIWPNSFVQLQFFALGGLAAIILRGRRPRLSPLSRASLVTAGIVSFFAAEYFYSAVVPDTLALPFMTVPGFLLIGLGVVLLFLGTLGITVPSLAMPLVYFGKISYGLYVFHLVVLNTVISIVAHIHLQHTYYLLDWIFALPLTILTAHLSYLFFESRFLLLKERFTVVENRAV